MKCLLRNKTTFYYCPYTSKTAVTDTSGYETGEYKSTYGTAVAIQGNISPASGNAQFTQFGNFLDYDKVIVIEDKNCPINENSALFIDKAPAYNTDGTPLFDYVVKKVARSLNSVSYAVSKVTTG